MPGKRILVVDDQPEVVELLKDVLSHEGYVVDGALDATEALRLIHDNMYDAAVVDFNLPEMNGIMLHRKMRQIDEELAERTLFASGLAQSDGNLEYYNSQGSGFLAKPFDIEQVISAVEQLARQAGDGG